MMDFKSKGWRLRGATEIMERGDMVDFGGNTRDTVKVVGMAERPVGGFQCWTRPHKPGCAIFLFPSTDSDFCNCEPLEPLEPLPTIPLETVSQDLFGREMQSLVHLQALRHNNDKLIELGVLTGEELEGYKLLSDALSVTHNQIIARLNYRKTLIERMAEDGRKEKGTGEERTAVSAPEGDAGEAGSGNDGHA